MKLKDRNLIMLIGIVLGALLGGIVALVFLRRSKEGGRLGLEDVSWRDLIGLIGPILALGRHFSKMSRRGISKPNIL
jgi:hypothetical protein